MSFRGTECSHCPHLAACLSIGKCLAWPEPNVPTLIPPAAAPAVPPQFSNQQQHLPGCGCPEMEVQVAGPHVITHMPTGRTAPCGGPGACPLCDRGTPAPAGRYLEYQATLGTSSSMIPSTQGRTEAIAEPTTPTTLNVEAIRDACGIEQWTPDTGSTARDTPQRNQGQTT